MGDAIVEPTAGLGTMAEEPSFPDEWISIAAYYIWKNDGQPDGRDTEYWERAKAELMQLRKEGNLPTSRPLTLEEER